MKQAAPALFAITLSLTGCVISTGRIASDGFGASMDELSVSRSFLATNFRFGPYAVSRIDHEGAIDRDRDFGVVSNGKRLLSVGDTAAFHGSRFTVSNPSNDARLEGRCMSNAITDDFKLGSLQIQEGKSASVQCTCRGMGAPMSMLAIERTGRNPLRGEVQVENRSLLVSAIHRSKEGMHFQEAIGFQIESEPGRAIGVIEVRHERVWLARDLSQAEKDSVACLLAGLLLDRRGTR